MPATKYATSETAALCPSRLHGAGDASVHQRVQRRRRRWIKESIAYLPDIVIIGSWGRHDWGLNKAATEVFTLQGFQNGYDDLVKRYQALSSHPKIFVSYPIPILYGQGDVPDQGVTTSSVLPAFDFIAKKYNLPIVDLYHPFLNHRELYKVPPDGEGEGEHANPAGLTLIAQTVFAAMKADLAMDGGMATDGSVVIVDASADRVAFQVPAAQQPALAAPVEARLSVRPAVRERAAIKQDRRSQGKPVDRRILRDQSCGSAPPTRRLLVLAREPIELLTQRSVRAGRSRAANPKATAHEDQGLRRGDQRDGSIRTSRFSCES